jgi:hypothetical protein
VDRERRKSNISVQTNLEAMLNSAQRQALPGIKYAGWVLRCLRKPVFTEPLFVVQNVNDGALGIMDEHGRIKVQAHIRVRRQDEQIQEAAPVEPLVWTK